MHEPHADLHVHTTVSDGSLTPPELPAAAQAGDVRAVAVTDHDRIHPGLPAPVVAVDGLTVVRGIELRVAAGDERIDLLGYGVEPTEALTAEIERLQRDRVERGTRIVDAVEDRLGVDLGIEPEPGIGRPHIARAIADSDADYGYDEAFRKLIGEGCPCYVARDVTPLDRGVELLREACPVVGVAHPLRYDDPAAALSVARDLDAVELYYPYDRPVGADADADDQGAVERAVDAAGLLPLGGSDAHDDILGRTGPPRPIYERLADRLPDPVPVAELG